MSIYTISVNGISMGPYEAETAAAAVLAYVRDAGYASVAEAAGILGQSEEVFLADLSVVEVEAAGNDSVTVVIDGREVLSTTTACCARCGVEGWAGDFPAQGGIVADPRESGRSYCDDCAVVNETNRAIDRVARDYDIDFGPDPDTRDGRVSRSAVLVTTAREIEAALADTDVQVSWAPDNDDPSLAWLYVAAR